MLQKSTFQPHLATVHSREDVAAVMAALLQNNKIAKVLARRVLQNLIVRLGSGSTPSLACLPDDLCSCVCPIQ